MSYQRKSLRETEFLFNVSKTVFFKCLKCLCIWRQCYCKCDLFSGCENIVDHIGYCFVCRINDTYYFYDFEEIKC